MVLTDFKTCWNYSNYPILGLLSCLSCLTYSFLWKKKKNNKWFACFLLTAFASWPILVLPHVTLLCGITCLLSFEELWAINSSYRVSCLHVRHLIITLQSKSWMHSKQLCDYPCAQRSRRKDQDSMVIFLLKVTVYTQFFFLPWVALTVQCSEALLFCSLSSTYFFDIQIQ